MAISDPRNRKEIRERRNQQLCGCENLETCSKQGPTDRTDQHDSCGRVGFTDGWSRGVHDYFFTAEGEGVGVAPPSAFAAGETAGAGSVVGTPG